MHPSMPFLFGDERHAGEASLPLLHLSMICRSLCACVQLAAGQPLWQLLEEPYKTLWLTWEETGLGNQAKSDDSQGAETRSAFLQSLAANAQAADKHIKPGDSASANGRSTYCWSQRR